MYRKINWILPNFYESPVIRIYKTQEHYNIYFLFFLLRLENGDSNILISLRNEDLKAISFKFCEKQKLFLNIIFFLPCHLGPFNGRFFNQKQPERITHYIWQPKVLRPWHSTEVAYLLRTLDRGLIMSIEPIKYWLVAS